jgi:hypothetical protein
VAAVVVAQLVSVAHQVAVVPVVRLVLLVDQEPLVKDLLVVQGKLDHQIELAEAAALEQLVLLVHLGVRAELERHHQSQALQLLMAVAVAAQARRLLAQEEQAAAELEEQLAERREQPTQAVVAVARAMPPLILAGQADLDVLS